MSDNPIWLITGASRGIGAAIAKEAHSHGCTVVMLARGGAVKELAGAMGERALGLTVDVADGAAVSAAVAEVIARFGRIDVLVNNAGLHRGGRVAGLSDADWQAVLDVNLTGPLNTIRAVMPSLQAGASIINIGAVVGFRGFAGDVAYASSKAGLSGMTKALAIELGRKGITANLVVPGLVQTEMTAGLSERALQSMKDKIPVARFGQEQEIASVVYWVSQSRYMTGATIPVDGGLLASFGALPRE